MDLAQAAIGTGMEIFTRFAKVLDAAGRQLAVRDALALINDVLDEILAEQRAILTQSLGSRSPGSTKADSRRGVSCR